MCPRVRCAYVCATPLPGACGANLVSLSRQLLRDGVRVIHAASPRAAAGFLQGGPEAGVGRQIRVGGEVGARGAFRERARAPVYAVDLVGGADEVEASREVFLVDEDLDDVV